MPPKIKFTKEDLINTSIEIVRNDGFESLNARSIASKLGCSVQPIFRVFASMEELKEAVVKKAWDIYNTKLLNILADDMNNFKGTGLAYIRFACEEKNLFKLLFMNDSFNDQNIMQIVGTTEGDNETIEMMSSKYKITAAQSQKLFTGLWFTVHGIASLTATNQCTITNKQTEEMLDMAMKGFLYSIKKEDK